MRTIFALLALSVSLCCSAGRPVYHVLSLADVVRTADVVAIVSTDQPAEKIIKDNLGCDLVQWHLIIESTLKSVHQGSPPAKSDVYILSNITSVLDCTLRTGWKTSGASFVATQYIPSDPTANTKKQFIVFLVVKNGVLELLTDNAFESINKKSDIESLLSAKS